MFHQESDNDQECKINSFIKTYDPDDPLHKRVVEVSNTIMIVSWISLILMVFLQLQLLNTLYTVILMNHIKYIKRKRSEAFVAKSGFRSLMRKKQIKKTHKKPKKEITHYFPMAWATIFIAIIAFVVILIRDVDSKLADCDSKNNHDYKKLYLGVYSTWLAGIAVAIYFPKHTGFPVPVVTALYERRNPPPNTMESKVFRVLTFTIQSLAIWILFCLMQLLTLHGIFFLVAILAKPVAMLVTIAYVSTIIGLVISGTSVMLEVMSVERINPWRSTSEKAVKFRLYNYLKDLPSLIGSALLMTFLLSLLFLVYQFGDKLGSTLNFSGVPAAISGTIQSAFFFLVSVALRKKSFRDIFEKKDYEEEQKPRVQLKPHEEPAELGDHEEFKDSDIISFSSEGPVHRFRMKWPHEFLHTDHYDDIDDDDDDDDIDDDDDDIDNDNNNTINDK